MVDCFEGSTDVQSSKELCDCGSNLLTVDLCKVLNNVVLLITHDQLIHLNNVLK